MLKSLLIFVLTIAAVQAKCVCRRAKPQDHFCAADYVIRAKVVKVPNIGRIPRNTTEALPFKFHQPQIYTLRVLKAYKGAIKLNRTVGFELHGVARGRNVRVKLFTPAKINSCRVKLRTGRIYLFGGHVTKKKLSLNRCSWVNTWHKMSFKQKGKLLKYRRLCKCKNPLKAKKKCKNKVKIKQKRIKLRKKRKHWNWKRS